MKTNKFILVVIACLSFQFISCASMEMQYESAKKADTIEAYEKYINEYPNSSNEIINRHKQLKDRDAFKEAEKINTKKAYQELIESHPDNLYIEEARKRIAESDKDSYARTLLIGTEKALAGYVDSYPSSIYLSDVKERINWISDQHEHTAKVEIKVRHLGFSESSLKKKKILKMLNNGLAGSGIYMASNKTAGADDYVMDVLIEYIGNPPPTSTVGEILSVTGGAIPALVGLLIDEMLEGKIFGSHKKIENGYKIQISYGNESSFDTGYYYLEAYDPSYFIKLHDVIIWLKESKSLSVNTLYTVMGIPDSRLRNETAKALSFTKNTFDQHFVTALNNNDWMVRESAVNVLSYREDTSLLSYIKPLAMDNHYRVRIAVLKALTSYDYKGSSELIVDALNDENELVREAAVIVQRIVKDKRAVPQLINCLQDHSKDVRVETAWTLKEIGDKRAVGALIETLGDKELLVRIRVESALESITGQKFGKDVEKWQKWLEQNRKNL